jgi:hypothetical protein
MDFAPLFAAISSHQWAIVAALAINLLIALQKQSWIGPLLAKIPASVLPFEAMALGMLGVVSTDLLAGKPWQASILAGLAAGFASIAGHQMVVESLRKGVELVPSAPWHEPPVADVKPSAKAA